MIIVYTSQFARLYKRLPNKVKAMAEEREQWFRANPFDPRLNTHKLQGKLKSFLSFSIGYSYRIVFEFGKNDTVFFYLIGNHDIYQ